MNILTKQIACYMAVCAQEETDKRIILELISKYGKLILSRKTETFHITVSGLVLNQKKTKILLVYHNIYNSWSLIGGHADCESDLIKVLINEIKEETGIIQAEPLSSHIKSIDILTTGHHIKNKKYIAPHLHLNISYFIMANEEDKIEFKADEVSGAEWIKINEIKRCVKDSEMSYVIDKLIRKL